MYIFIVMKFYLCLIA